MTSKVMLPDNPALRLSNIINKIVNDQCGDMVNKPAIHLLSTLFGVEYTDPCFFYHYAKLILLVEESFEKIKEVKPERVKYNERWRKHISTCLTSFNPSANTLAQYRSELGKAEVLERLEVASDFIDYHSIGDNIDVDLIDDLASKIDEIKSEILDSNDFSDEFKNFILSEFDKIIESLRNYDLNGAVPIRESIYRVASNMEVLHSSDKTGISKKILNILSVAAMSVSLVNDVAEFPNSLNILKNSYAAPLIEKIYGVDKVDEEEPTIEV